MAYSHLLRALLVASIATAPLLADSIDIGPTRVQMIGPERTATITIRNSNSAPANIQVRTLDWSQPDGKDQYDPSNVLLASPPQAALAPGESQVIRLVVEKLPPGASEHAFRVVIDQIPNERAPEAAAVRTSIRALVPVFITPSAQDRPRLRWEARRSGGDVMLTAINEGVVHDRLVGMVVTAGGEPLGNPLEGYVLGNAKRIWTVAAVPAGTASLNVAGEGEFGQVRADVPIAP